MHVTDIFFLFLWCSVKFKKIGKNGQPGIPTFEVGWFEESSPQGKIPEFLKTLCGYVILYCSLSVSVCLSQWKEVLS